MPRNFWSLCLIMQAQSYNRLVEQAMEYTRKDSLKQAEQLFRQALKVDASNARNALVFSNLGTILKRQGRVDEAVDAYTMALNITPYATSILLNRAALYLDRNLLDKAYVDYCNVIDLIPETGKPDCFGLISICSAASTMRHVWIIIQCCSKIQKSYSPTWTYYARPERGAVAGCP